MDRSVQFTILRAEYLPTMSLEHIERMSPHKERTA